MIKTILFDLDGTLTDPYIGITNSVIYSLKHYGIEVENRSSLKAFIGPPLTESFIKFYSFSEDKAKEAVEIYREYFSTKGLFENTVYDGIPELLKFLKDKGMSIALATSKPEVFAEQILKHFDLKKYFDCICGSELNHKRTDKHEVIEYTLNKLSENRENTVMIGDRLHDIIGGKKSQLITIGVTYGYGSIEELSEYGANYIANDVQSLKNILSTI